MTFFNTQFHVMYSVSWFSNYQACYGVNTSAKPGKVLRPEHDFQLATPSSDVWHTLMGAITRQGSRRGRKTASWKSCENKQRGDASLE